MSVVTGDAAPRHMRDVHGRLQRRFLGLNERIWQRVPDRVRNRRLVRSYGAWMHRMVGRQAHREMYLGTSFLRNRPTFELMSRLVREADRGSAFEVAVLGCSIGVEVYSVVWTLRSSRPDLDVSVDAIDISPDVLRVAERGVYSSAASELARSSLFDGLTDDERREMFDWDDGGPRVKAWLREGIRWGLGDAGDPSLVDALGSHDLVVANNFLCHMPATAAEACLRNLVKLVRPGGYLLVTGVDLDVRTKVALDLGWQAVPELLAEIHDGDPLVRADWPWQWWGLEPFDSRRPDWETRYCAVFRIPAGSRAAASA
jgi:chemotaxis methyl-accepting protein methylase